MIQTHSKRLRILFAVVCAGFLIPLGAQATTAKEASASAAKPAARRRKK